VPFAPGKPNLVLAHTVKGKGISFIEDQVTWHHHVPTDQEFAKALGELESSEQRWQAIHDTSPSR
jgi:transketolase